MVGTSACYEGSRQGAMVPWELRSGAETSADWTERKREALLLTLENLKAERASYDGVSHHPVVERRNVRDFRAETVHLDLDFHKRM